MNSDVDPTSDFDHNIELRNFKSAPKRTPHRVVNLEDGTTPLLQQELDIPSHIARPGHGEYEEKPGLLEKIGKYFAQEPISITNRLITFDRNVYPENKVENIVRNQKYTKYSFIPGVLCNQLKSLFNVFFFVVALSQLIDDLKVGFLFSYLGPLVLMVIVAMAKEGFDEYNRYKDDEEVNSEVYKVFADKFVRIEQPSSALKVGDIIEVNAKQRIPADLLLLSTSDESGKVFIRTDQVDGQTEFKIREPVKYTQEMVEAGQSLFGINAKVNAEAARADLCDFTGRFEAGSDYAESLSLENTIWANNVLVSGTVYGLVLYTGKETRMALNTREPRSKTGNLDKELNNIARYVFIFMLLLSAVIMIFRGFGVIQYLKYVLLLSSIIPISLRVNLDLAKAVFSYRISKDIERVVVKNRAIPEELGRVEFLLLDKTGTLTQNEMTFRKLLLEDGKERYDESSFSNIEEILKKQCKKTIHPALPIAEKIIKEGSLGPVAPAKKNKPKRKKGVVLRHLITALSVCNNVTPIKKEEGGNIVYEGESGEVALVKMAENVKMKLIGRSETRITIENAAGVQENYEILANFPFTSDRKRMGMILKHEEKGRIIFYLKGADIVMKGKLEYQRGSVLEEVRELANQGLRTLIIARKSLTKKEYQAWNARYQRAKNETVNRDAQLKWVIESLEVDMELLGVTGVEDKLQVDVSYTIESLRDAGMRIWMLTGDNIEAGYRMAASVGLKSNRQEYLRMEEMEDPVEIQSQLARFNNHAFNTVLFIDGTTLVHVFEHHRKYFFDITCKAPAVICCRVSAAQKALIAEAIKELQQKTVCCVGDGANDVGMIRVSDVGIGILGKEGKQAALAADFSVLKFRDIKPLLLWHGKNAYKQTAAMTHFVVYRGLIMTIIQALFTIVFNSVNIPVYNGYFMLAYATIFSIFPVLCLLLDSDVSKRVAETYAPLYKTMQNGRELSKRTFLTWAWKSIYQGGLIMLLSIVLFPDSYLQTFTMIFIALIAIEFLNICSSVYQKNEIFWIFQIGTFLIYNFSMDFLRNYIDMSTGTSVSFVLKAIGLALVSWIPLHTIRFLSVRRDHSETAKILRRGRIIQRQEEEEEAAMIRFRQRSEQQRPIRQIRPIRQQQDALQGIPR